MTFNPELETDYTFANWVKDKKLKAVQHLGSSGQLWTSAESRDSVVVKMTHKDNPWFPDVLTEEMEAERG